MQIALPRSAIAFDPSRDVMRGDGLREVAPDLAYQRLAIVNVVFWGAPGAGDRGWVLIDAGLPGTAPFIKSAAARRFGPRARPAAIIMTHGHFDHVGVLETLARDWDAPVYAHELEQPYLAGEAYYPPGDPSVGGGAMAAMARLYPRAPVNVGARLKKLPGDGSVPHMPGWRWIHTPGHSVGHVSLWHEGSRTLVAGDAVVTTGQESAGAVMRQRAEMHGPPAYFTVEWDKARATVRRLAELEPELLVTGHGHGMRGGDMTYALRRLARDFDRLALPRHGHYIARPARAEDGTAYRPE